jgi:hypothetical protein
MVISVPEGSNVEGDVGRRGCRIDGGTTTRGTNRERSSLVEVRIGIVQTPKELEVDLGEGADRDTVLKEIDESLERGGVLWLTDRRGRRIAVPTAQVAYVEVGAPANERRVGFGAP